MCKRKKCAKLIIEHQYVLWNNKIHCFIIPVYNIPRNEFAFTCTIQGTYHILPGSLEGEETLAPTSCQTVNSTPAARVSALAVVSGLEEPSEDNNLLSHSKLTQIFMRSCSRKNMLMTR